MSYYVMNQRNSATNVSNDADMAEFCLSKDDIIEHLEAQVAYLRNGHREHKIQPIVVGVSQEKFVRVVDHLCRHYKGFLATHYLAKGVVPIKLTAKGSEVIRIVNMDMIKEEE